MKIVKDDDIYILPEKKKINIIVNNENCNNFVECLGQYFTKKKNGYCQIYDENGNKIKNNEIDFIFVPLNVIDDNMEMKKKSIVNNEIVEYVKENETEFLSIEEMRKSMHELLSDSGTTYITKMLNFGLNEKSKIEVYELNISDIIQMLRINCDNMSETIKMIMIYNLLIQCDKDKAKLVYIEFPVDDRVIDWMRNYNDYNVQFIINSKMINNLKNNIKCSLIYLSKINFLEEYLFKEIEFNDYLYIFNPFVWNNKNRQTKENIAKINQFDNENTTYYLTFDDDCIQIKTTQ